MLAKAPKVSVVVPVYNTGPYLASALDSIFAQSFTDFELIAVDDGSTDGSSNVLADLANGEPRMRVLSQANGGIVSALNNGIAEAKGTYIARMDGDDIAYPGRIAAQVERLDDQSDVVALGTQFRLVDPDGRALKHSPVPCDHDALEARLLRDQSLSICHPSAMIRRSALEEIGGYSADYPHAEDVDLWLRLAEVGKLANLEKTLLDYRMHHSSIGMTKRQAQLDSAHRAGHDAALRRGLPAPEVRTAQEVARTLHATFLRWGWWALGDGNVSTARFYARRSLAAAPFSVESWRLGLMALRGH